MTERAVRFAFGDIDLIDGAAGTQRLDHRVSSLDDPGGLVFPVVLAPVIRVHVPPHGISSLFRTGCHPGYSSALMASTLSSFSQGRSQSVRPKCP